MSHILQFALALVVVAILALAICKDRKSIRIRFVIQLLVIEVLLAYFFLHSEAGLGFVKGFAGFFDTLLGFAAAGTDFVFNDMGDKGLAFFFLRVLCPIVFISALIGILQYIKVLPIVIRLIGTLLSKVNGMGKLESFNAVSSLILGQSENFIAYKDILGKMSENACTPWRQQQCRPFPCRLLALICPCWMRNLWSPPWYSTCSVPLSCCH